VRLQAGRVESGIPDVEIELGTDIAVVFEAKPGVALSGLSPTAKVRCYVE
jgi:hypothetical protein